VVENTIQLNEAMAAVEAVEAVEAGEAVEAVEAVGAVEAVEAVMQAPIPTVHHVVRILVGGTSVEAVRILVGGTSVEAVGAVMGDFLLGLDHVRTIVSGAALSRTCGAAVSGTCGAAVSGAVGRHPEREAQHPHGDAWGGHRLREAQAGAHPFRQQAKELTTQFF
jgi:hypothetical protein